MPNVDSEGRVELPQELREELGITPGSVVEVYEEDGRVVIDPEVPPETILERMDEILEEGTVDRDRLGPPDVAGPCDFDPHVQRHLENVRRGAERDPDE